MADFKYVFKANQARTVELGTKTLMKNLERYSKLSVGEKNAAHEDAMHRMLRIYLGRSRVPGIRSQAIGDRPDLVPASG